MKDLVFRFQLLTPLNLPKGETSDTHPQKIFRSPSLAGGRGGQNDESLTT